MRTPNFFSEVRRIQNRFHNLFDPVSEGGQVYPALNVYTDQDKISVTAEVPGLSPEDLDITVAHNLLTISGEWKEYTQDRPRRIERARGKFQRRLELPVAVDSEKVEASVKDGVLTLELPILESEKPRKIRIEAKA
ncbi:Hsp20/alpha crystallin family protein [Leptospira licerasiae]|uniref:Hsp20/alpha crystallin family protein n=1 Tax=Leptospira licerasiae str. MMD4847 TaxID=1049971 RepID=A0ABP2RCA0_9LEPT|nr:Hsp20/alpha crystallin family protein [Leptospira licerasiae]EID99932.1 Hsp20/alpha crystallin family protein [Leptospira licerasiae serovar Varillal str. VAR 010]EJZ42028.1 Hsp20/alpha crystallin family protein [Leptospira licerasiae str. MMD4847]TGM94757.1 Hsp20/alpha crystallin family protein [Leptospira licerasiae]